MLVVLTHELQHDYLSDNSLPVVLLKKKPQNKAGRPELLLVFGAMLCGAFDPPIP